MVSGHLSEKKGHYYAVITYKDGLGNRKTKWIATGLPVKGNKKRAEAFLNEQKLKADINRSTFYSHYDDVRHV
ncbi:MAG: site-specific integrase, partial [Candidatus Limivicinus sp.]